MKNLLIFTVTLLLLAGCKPNYSSSPTYKVVKAEEVVNFIIYSNNIHSLNGVLVPDAEYALPTVDWITKEYTPQLKKFLFDYQLTTPVEIENDCDKFSQYGLTVGHIMHYHAKKPKGTALSIGSIMYIDNLEGHAINFFVAIDAYGNMVLVFYEPQLQQIIPLDLEGHAVLHWMM